MTIQVINKAQPVLKAIVKRNGFSEIHVTTVESGKIKLAAQKDGVSAYLLTKGAAKDLIEALTVTIENGEYAGN